MDHLSLIALGLAGGGFAWALKVGAAQGAVEARVKGLEKALESEMPKLESRFEERMNRIEGKLDALIAAFAAGRH